MRNLLKSLVAAALVVPAFSLAAPMGQVVSAATCGVSIYEIYYDSPGTDNGSNSSLNGEWIQLRNSCSTSQSLSGWRFRDAAGHTYKKFGTFALGGGAKVKIHTGKGTNTTTDRFWGLTGYVWNNTGSETATLKNSAGTTVDKCTYNGTGGTYIYC